MRRIALFAAALALASTLSACANTSSTLHHNDRFSGMTLSMPVGAVFK